jgi:hypothetical protein
MASLQEGQKNSGPSKRGNMKHLKRIPTVGGTRKERKTGFKAKTDQMR